MGEFLTYLFLASVNIQNADIYVNKSGVFARKGTITRSIKEYSYKFMKDRIRIFDMSKYK